MNRPLRILVFAIYVVVLALIYYNFRHIWSPSTGPAVGDVATVSRNSGNMDTTAGGGDSPNIRGSMAGIVNEDVQLAQADGSVEVTPVVFTLFTPLPAAVAPDGYALTDSLVDLGRHLFYEPRLSVTQELSCNTCHPLSQYGADNLPVSLGHDGTPGKRNSPTVYNAALHISQFWDGRSPTIEEQAKGPITSEIEMGMLDEDYVVQVLRSIPGYRPLFRDAFPEQENPITFDNVAIALGAFQRGLLTPSRFDRFLEGDPTQLTDVEKSGLNTFIELGCPSCHTGTTVGGVFYKKLGQENAYETNDLGRYLVTGEEEDRYVFKVPSLRNVAHTAPYLHDGSIQTLEEMVLLMAHHQLDKPITPQQVSQIVAFLQSLSGEIPAEYIEPPSLPKSGVDTPAPKK